MKILLFSYIVASSFAVYVNYKNRQSGLKGIAYVQCLNPLKWGSYAYGYIFKILMPQHVLEQYILRFYDDDCSVCVKEGKCIGGKNCGLGCSCGCDTIAKMWSPIEKDSGSNWDKIIFNKKRYLEHRTENPVKINISYGKQ